MLDILQSVLKIIDFDSYISWRVFLMVLSASLFLAIFKGLRRRRWMLFLPLWVWLLYVVIGLVEPSGVMEKDRPKICWLKYMSKEWCRLEPIELPPTDALYQGTWLHEGNPIYEGDELLSVNGITVTSDIHVRRVFAEIVKEALPIELRFRRNGDKNIYYRRIESKEKPRLGISFRTDCLENETHVVVNKVDEDSDLQDLEFALNAYDYSTMPSATSSVSTKLEFGDNDDNDDKRSKSTSDDERASSKWCFSNEVYPRKYARIAAIDGHEIGTREEFCDVISDVLNKNMDKIDLGLSVPVSVPVTIVYFLGSRCCLTKLDLVVNKDKEDMNVSLGMELWEVELDGVKGLWVKEIDTSLGSPLLLCHGGWIEGVMCESVEKKNLFEQIWNEIENNIQDPDKLAKAYDLIIKGKYKELGKITLTSVGGVVKVVLENENSVGEGEIEETNRT